MPKPEQITLKISTQDLPKLKNCLTTLQDLLEINRLLEDSCAKIPKTERNNLENFIHQILQWSNSIQEKNEPPKTEPQNFSNQ